MIFTQRTIDVLTRLAEVHLENEESSEVKYKDFLINFEHCSGQSYEISLYYKEVFMSTFSDENYEDAISILLGKSFNVCECGFDEVYKNNHCKKCYVLADCREDRCCICLENNAARWVKLGCGHEIHYKCILQLQPNLLINNGISTKCPLCRADIEKVEMENYTSG